MIEFKIELEEKVVEDFGYANIEKFLKEFATKFQMQLAAKEMLEDFGDIDLNNDGKWKIAREEAWKDQKDFYLNAPKRPANA
ncbi:MAG: hypothetical protein H6577_06890 [Lewinellaceae bacterium]|nr:hypothetical protein [Saprospiraceae bacterium]MCB9337836.1 hypothetical protein [Lewinellaceae bacterium]